MLYHPTNASALPGKTGNTKNVFFRLSELVDAIFDFDRGTYSTVLMKEPSAALVMLASSLPYD